MVFEFDFEKNLAEYKRVYRDFLLPVFICDAKLEMRWCNGAAEDMFPQFAVQDGARKLLGEFDAAGMFAALKRDGVRRIDGALGFSDVRLNLTPIMQDGEVSGMMIMLIGPQAVVSRRDIVESSKTPDNIDNSIRGSVIEIFDIMDKSARKADWIGDAAVLPVFSEIERSGYRLLRIAANISSYTRFQTDPPRPAAKVLDLFDFIRKSEAAVSAFARETGIEVRFSLPSENKAAPVAIEAKHLQLVYSNLLNNALYFTKPGNMVDVIAGADDNRIWLTVRDKGLGIPADVLPRVLNPYYFYSRDGKSTGIGLGLTLVRMIADGCAGKVAIESVENEGTTATFILPNRAFDASVPFKQDTAQMRPGYNDRFSYASVSLRAAADSPYRQD